MGHEQRAEQTQGERTTRRKDRVDDFGAGRMRGEQRPGDHRVVPLRLPARVRETYTGSKLDHALGGFRYVWHNPRIFTILALFVIVGIFGWSYPVLMPAFARKVLGLGEQAYGALLTGSGTGALAGALCITAASKKITPRMLALGGVWIFWGMIILFALNRNFYAALGCSPARPSA